MSDCADPSPTRSASRPLWRGEYKRGDAVIYRQSKLSPHPGPRAEGVRPMPTGEDYSYCVNKFWIIAEDPGDKVVVKTRRGKVHRIDVDDPNLRHAHWWEKLIYRDRFPHLEHEKGERSER